MLPIDATVLSVLARLTKDVKVGLAWLDAAGRHVFANDAYASAFGRTVEGIVGTTFAEVVEHTLPPPPARFDLARDGRWFELQVRDAEVGSGWLIQLEDVTEVRERERLSPETMPKLVEILQSFHDIVLVIDAQLVVRWMSRNAAEMFAQRRMSMVGRALPELFPQMVGSDAERRLRTALTTGRTDHFEVQFPPSNRWLEVHLNPGDNELTIVIRDVTERKIATEQLRRSEHLRALGRLAGGVAHEINNQMTVVVGFGSMLALRLPDERDRAQVDRMVAAAERASRVSSQLLAFSRRQVARPETLPLNAVLEEFRPMLERILGSELRLGYELCPDDIQVFADRAQLEQVLVSLVSNARDATPEGREVSVSTARLPIHELSEQAWYAGSPATAAEWVVLSVQDQGEGMSAEVAARAFEPFFTTRPVGEGTGLGLSTVYGVVTAAGGVVGLDTQPGNGTRVRLALPAGGAPLPQPTRVPVTGTGLVLLVEEEPATRAALSRALVEGGFSVVSAADAEAALMALEGQSPTAVVVDLGLPQARRMVRRLRDGGRPRVLYVSPQPREDLERRGVLESDEAFLQKPFGVQVLLHRLAELVRG